MSRWKRIGFAAFAVAMFFVLAELILWGLGVDTLLARRDPFQGFSRQVRVFEPDAELVRQLEALGYIEGAEP